MPNDQAVGALWACERPQVSAAGRRLHQPPTDWAPTDWAPTDRTPTDRTRTDRPDGFWAAPDLVGATDRLPIGAPGPGQIAPDAIEWYPPSFSLLRRIRSCSE
jgi:hypothetical protein